MNATKVLTSALGLVCAAAVYAVVAQHQQLAGLQAEQKRVLAQLGSEPAEPAVPAKSQAEQLTSSAGTDPELIRLRAEVTQLAARKRELASVAAENERLRAQVASRGTNAANARTLLLSKAQFVGYKSPEDTLQTLLWSVQQRDYTNFVKAFAPAVVQALPTGTEDAWRNALNSFHEQLSGLTIVGRRELPGGQIELDIEMLPLNSTPHPLHFMQVGGEWKLADLR